MSLKVFSDRDRVSLEQKSWVRFADYKGSKADGINESRGYYFLPANARAAFTQGILQNIQHTAGGIDKLTGRSITPNVGIIDNPITVSRIAQRLAASEGSQTSENLVPIFNEQGKVTAYERSVDPDQLSALGQSVPDMSACG